MNTIDKILLTIAIFILLFTVTVIVLFCLFQSTPDTLVECVFGLMGSEVIITAVIWYMKRRFNLIKDEDNEDE